MNRARIVCVLAATVWAAEPTSLPLSSIRRVTQEQARGHQDISTSGIVTYVTTARPAFFLQDGDVAIFVRNDRRTAVAAGDEVRVRGRVVPGGYAPVIQAEVVEVVGKKPVPSAVPTSVPELLLGNWHCARVEVAGVLRSIDFHQATPNLRLDQQGHLLLVRLDHFDPEQARAWVGRPLRIAGVANSLFNFVGQMTDVVLLSSPSDVTILAGAAEPVPPRTPIGRVLTFAPTARHSAAVHVAGRITYSREDRLHVVQDATGAMVVESASIRHIPLGAAVEVAGYAKLGGVAPSLTDAVLTPLPETAVAPVSPLRAQPSELDAGLLDSRLVTLEGTLLSASPGVTGGISLRFENGGREFAADLDAAPPGEMEPGTRYAVTGVVFRLGNAYEDSSRIHFRLHLRTAADLQVLAPPPFWNWDRTTRLAGVLIVSCLAAVFWIMLLRRRVRAQTALVEESLEQERQIKSSFQELFENASDLIFTLDAQGRILFANRAVTELTGYKPEQLTGSEFTLLLPRTTPAAWARWIGRAAKSRQSILRTERKLTTRTEEFVTVEFNIRILKGSANQPLTVQAIGRDITQRKRIEETLERARQKAEEANLAKSEFLAKMSHEIRTPMNGVKGMTELLLDTALDPRQRNMAGTIRDSSEALLRVINDILDFSKLEAEMVEIQPVSTNLRRIFEDVLDLLGFAAREKRIELVFDYAPELPHHFIADGGRLRQMILNLASNAVKFTDEGYVRLSVSVNRAVAPALVEVRVEDSGIGIPAAKQTLLFQKFQQIDNSSSRQYGGSGLGLAITRRLIELMGGTIKVESVEGRGSIFSFSVPLDIDEAAEATRERYIPLGGQVVVADKTVVRHDIWEGFVRSFGQEAILSADSGQAIRRFSELGPECSLIAVCAQEDSELLALRAELLRLNPEAQRRVIILAWPNQRALFVACDAQWQTVVRPTHCDQLYASLRRSRSFTATNPNLPTDASAGLAKLELNVLLAEDNTVNLRVATAFLERLGCRVDVATDGAVAVDLTAVNRYDVVLMDCHMPKMDGYEATREIRARGGRWATLPIVALTAAALPEDQTRCFEAGMDHYLSKPLDAAQLERLLTALQESQLKGALSINEAP